MICPHCDGKGRIVGITGIGRGNKAPYVTHEIMPCPHCHAGHQHCCEGDRAEVMVEITRGLPEGMKCEFVWAEPDAEDLNGSG